MSRALLLSCALLLGFGVGCGKDRAPEPKPSCIEGRSLGCSCIGGKSGAQVCTSKGTFGPCECTPDDREALDEAAQKRVSKMLRRLRRMRNWKRQRRAIGKMLAKANKQRAMANTAAEIRAANLRREEILAVITKLAEPPREPPKANRDAGVGDGGVVAKPEGPVVPVPKVRIPKVCKKDPNGKACQEASMKGTP